MKKEYYFSIDIEADGRYPGVSSMLSLGAAVFTIDKKLVGKFSRNIELLPGSVPTESVTNFWNRFPKEYADTRVDMVTPQQFAADLIDFVESFKGYRIFVGYPAATDYKWLDHYLGYAGMINPFGHADVIDMKSYAWAVSKQPKFKATSKRTMPKDWFDDLPHTHIAYDDALEQGCLFINMLRANCGLEPIESYTE